MKFTCPLFFVITIQITIILFILYSNKSPFLSLKTYSDIVENSTVQEFPTLVQNSTLQEFPTLVQNSTLQEFPTLVQNSTLQEFPTLVQNSALQEFPTLVQNSTLQEFPTLVQNSTLQEFPTLVQNSALQEFPTLVQNSTLQEFPTLVQNSSVQEFPTVVQNSTVQEFLTLLSPLQPVIIDISLVECCINESSCSKVQENRLIRFGLHIGQWENKSTALGQNDHTVHQMNSFTFILSKMYPVDHYFVVPGLPEFSLKSLHLPVAKLVQLRNALVLENLELMQRFLKNPFVECKKDLAEKIRKDHPQMYEEKNVVIKNSYVKTLHAFVEFSYSIGLYPMFTDGTLLGWYRECGFIPHTTDVDLTVFDNQIGYKQVLQYELINNTVPQCKISEKFGFVNKSHHEYLELSFICAQVKIDLFVFYNDEHETWQGGRGVRWVFPLIKEDGVCTAILLGHLFFVPCQVEQILVASYGPDWRIIHHSSNYSWDKSPKNIEAI